MNAPPISSDDLARERGIVLTVAAVQLVNILEFMMIVPLGPDFAKALDFPATRIGLVSGSYTAAAAVSGLAGALVLDRFDRRRALGLLMVGLVVATALGGLATGLESLVAARVLAGLFGGPATSVALSIVSDVVPPERRGRAMGAVMGAFSLASVLGVPAGLELARVGSWRAPVLVIAGLALLVTIAAYLLLPPMRGHLEREGRPSSFGALLLRPGVPLALFTMATVMVATFCLVPNLPAYLQNNALYPRETFGRLYLVGGSLSLLIMLGMGRLVDRVGPVPVVALSAAVLTLDLAVGTLGGDQPRIPALLFFVGFMGGTSIRGVALSALTSKVPPPAERARFQSALSAVQHLACAAGALLGAALLSEGPGKRLVGMERVGAFSIALTVLLPLFVWALDRTVRAQARAAQPAVA